MPDEEGFRMKRGLLVFVLTGILTAGSSQMLFAVEDGAGCGIGKVILEGKSGKGPNIVASILNDILIPRTVFMTTASAVGEPILGCDPSQTVQNEAEKNFFVASNIDKLSQEMAQGGGGHLEALADAMGIKADDKPEFYLMTQAEYANLFPAADTDAGGVMDSLRLAMAGRPSLAHYVR
jgi:hypothetical protein